MLCNLTSYFITPFNQIPFAYIAGIKMIINVPSDNPVPCSATRSHNGVCKVIFHVSLAFNDVASILWTGNVVKWPTKSSRIFWHFDRWKRQGHAKISESAWCQKLAWRPKERGLQWIWNPLGLSAIVYSSDELLKPYLLNGFAQMPVSTCIWYNPLILK